MSNNIVHLTIIPVIIFCIIFIIRVLIEIKIEQTRAKREEEKKHKLQKLKKEEEEKFRKKEQENVKILTNSKEEGSSTSPQVVDFVKPVGFWTSMVLGQKITHLINSANIMNNDNRKGFWVRMVEAQDRAAGRQRGRSR
jgi:hypothetical protein